MTLVLDENLIPITNLFDRDGESVDDIKQAYSFVAGPLPDGQWLADCLENYIIHEAQ